LDDVTRTFAERGDLAHLALFLWASGASGLLVWSLRELAASNRRFNDFVAEIARFNQVFSSRPLGARRPGADDEPAARR